MPSFTVAGGNPAAVLTYTSTDASAYGFAVSNQIGAQNQSGALTNFNYSGTIPGGTNEVTFTTTTAGQVVLPTTVQAVIDASATPVNISGGAPGASVVAGSGGLFYSNITPTGTATANIVAGDGNNSITTSTSGGGNYVINTGAGNDTISITTGNGTVNAGTGSNLITLGNGNSIIQSEGFDSIVGNITAGGGGTDTVAIGSGQTTINPGSSNFLVTFTTGTDANPFTFLAGTGSSTVFASLGASTITGGLAGNNLLVGGLSAAGSTITGGGRGDVIFAVGGGSVNATAGSGNETLTGAGGNSALYPSFTASTSTAANIFTAGTGNDLLVGGSGATTYNFRAGASGGADTIAGFKAADTLSLTGYASSGATATSVSAAITAGGGTLRLVDGTSITLNGVTSLSSSQIKIT